MPFPSVSPSYPLTENPVFLKAPAALPAAGAFDVPIEFSVAGFTFITLFFEYVEDAQATDGALVFKIECSPFALDQTVYADWYQSALYEAGNLAVNNDTDSAIQREQITYGATGGNPEQFVYGPIAIQGNIERMRISVAEVGDTNNPGIASIIAMLYSLG